MDLLQLGDGSGFLLLGDGAGMVVLRWTSHAVSYGQSNAVTYRASASTAYSIDNRESYQP